MNLKLSLSLVYNVFDLDIFFIKTETAVTIFNVRFVKLTGFSFKVLLLILFLGFY